MGYPNFTVNHSSGPGYEFIDHGAVAWIRSSLKDQYNPRTSGNGQKPVQDKAGSRSSYDTCFRKTDTTHKNVYGKIDLSDMKFAINM